MPESRTEEFYIPEDGEIPNGFPKWAADMCQLFAGEKIDDLQEDKESDLEKVNSWEKKKLEEIRQKAQEKRDQVREQYDPGIQELRDKRERLNERIEQAVAAEETKQTLQKRKEELATLEDRYERYTEAIENPRSLRTDFEDDLPRDVSIADDGEILNPEGRRYEYWNEQKQVHFAMEMSEMRDSPLNLIVLDGVERIVGDQREALLDWCRESDAQFILTEAVPTQELTVDHE